MKHSVRIRLVKMGNSRGIVIPEAMLDRFHINDEVEIAFEDDHFEIRPIRKPPEGWGEALMKMANSGDDRLLDESGTSSWDSVD